ncbi:Uncharacterised protein [Mycobacteroides abscessus]|nr:Uncharacterised protein [Mycobacteroides abscessus]
MALPYFTVEANQCAYAEVVGQPLDICQYLGALGIEPGPFRVACIPELICLRRDINADAGIHVVPPGATDGRGPLEDGDIADAGPQQVAGHPDTGQPGTDDHHVVINTAVGPFRPAPPRAHAVAS